MFRNIHDAFKPIYDPSDNFDVTPVKTVYVAVREDGPDAFGQKVKIPPKSYYKRSQGCWQYNEDPHDRYEWITLVGSKILVLTEDGSYIRYEGRDIDG